MLAKRDFGDGITLWRITNRSGAYIEVMNYGAVLHSVFMPDRQGRLEDVILGARDAAAAKGFCLSGMVVGRCANRIVDGRFTIGDTVFQLDKNERGKHTLHSAGGNYGTKLFALAGETEDSVTLYYHDDGRAGFVSQAEVFVTYRLSEDNEVRLTYHITPDGDTVVNPTNHAYFNLSGNASRQVLDTVLKLNAATFTPKGSQTNIPEGDYAFVAGTPFDFREGRTLGENLSPDPLGLLTGDPAHPQYDDSIVLSGAGWRQAAVALDPAGGRRMEVWTDLPGVQFYTPYLKNPIPNKYGLISGYCAFCLETQFYPNAINCPTYPSPLCRAGESFVSETAYRFSVE